MSIKTFFGRRLAEPFPLQSELCSGNTRGSLDQPSSRTAPAPPTSNAEQLKEQGRPLNLIIHPSNKYNPEPLCAGCWVQKWHESPYFSYAGSFPWNILTAPTTIATSSSAHPPSSGDFHSSRLSSFPLGPLPQSRCPLLCSHTTSPCDWLCPALWPAVW